MKKLLLSGKGKNTFALVDDEDFGYLSKYKWYLNKASKMVIRNRLKTDGAGSVSIYLHREIMPKGEQIDHINRNRLDNRRTNLRICTRSQNCMNRIRDLKYKTSKFHGIFWSKSNSAWRARITKNGKYKHLGYFKSEKEAAMRYDTFARNLFGEFAFINFP